MVFSVVGFIVSGALLLVTDVFGYKKAKNVARPAFRMR